MIGYVNKSRHQSDFAFIRLNISEEEVERGLDLHARLGAGDLKNMTEISPTNIFKKAKNFWVYKMGQNREDCNISNILTKMMQTGAFYPAARWITPAPGMGLCHERADAIFRAYVSPADITEDDVQEIFLTDRLPGDMRRGQRNASGSSGRVWND